MDRGTETQLLLNVMHLAYLKQHKLRIAIMILEKSSLFDTFLMML